jgi:hypothetical protein
VLIQAGAAANIIGTNGDGVGDLAERNIISGNTADGVHIQDAGTTGNVVAGNFIGTDVTGTAPMGNSQRGIWILAPNNQVGGSALAQRNVISANVFDGVVLSSNGNKVQGNYIGTDVSGSTSLGNGFNGIAISGGAQSNTIGTDGDGVNDASEGNLLSGNVARGVIIAGAGTNYNVVAGNLIGTNATGTAALPNHGDAGVTITSGAQGNRIGTNADGVSDALERNIISANTGSGVRIQNANSEFNVVAGNYIGTDGSDPKKRRPRKFCLLR